jgi:cysteine-rich repeat protein
MFTQMGVEECDDGNMSNADACIMGCKLNKCGDTFVNMGVEECDDGNLVPNDGCGATCKLENVASAEKLAINLAIPDDKYTGPGVDPLKVACVDLMVAKAGTVATAQVTVGLDHTWIGDLVIKLISPGNAKVLTLMSRPGLAELAWTTAPTPRSRAPTWPRPSRSCSRTAGPRTPS